MSVPWLSRGCPVAVPWLSRHGAQACSGPGTFHPTLQRGGKEPARAWQSPGPAVPGAVGGFGSLGTIVFIISKFFKKSMNLLFESSLGFTEKLGKQ